MLENLLKEIIGELATRGALTRQQLVEALHTPRTTIYEHLIKLERSGIVSSSQQPRTTRGRPKTLWVLKRNYWDETK